MMKRILLVLVMLALPLSGGWAAGAETRAKVSGTLNYTALQRGQEGVAAVVVDVGPGLHVQSHRPGNEAFIKLEVKPEANAAVEWMPAVYPAGQDVEYPMLGKLNVYTGRVIVHVPFVVKKEAVEGTVRLSGKVIYQACDDKSCFPPEEGTFTIDTRIVKVGESIKANEPGLFAGFDPTIFSAKGMVSPPTDAVAMQLFGWRFMLGESAYLLALVVAFFVGIIFNLMPCVLPVVPLKAIGFYEVSQHNRARSMLLGGVFSLGLLSAFAVLAVMVVIYQKAWGEQFSNPWFVWTMVAILTVFAFGMFGAFSVILPAGVYRFTPNHQTVGGNFLFGAFTALLSTPCTAPMFVGLLIWAGQQPKWVGMATVMTVGLGMAFPYFLLSAVPELARRFPRSGPWSELIKQMMGFLLLAVAVYFAGGRLIEGRGFFWAVFGVVAVGSVFLIVRTIQLTKRQGAIAWATGIALAMSGAMLWFTLNLTGTAWANGKDLIPWRPYSMEALEEAREAGKTVMVEFTANWCANCLELEARVFRDPRTANVIEKNGVVALRADLTRSDAPGWGKLKELNPSGGIPLTAIYKPGLGEPVQLSSIYTTENLVRAVSGRQ